MFNIFKKTEKAEYKFSDPENTLCFTCNHVVIDKKPILYASHDNEGDWQFLCGQENHSEQNAKIISLKEVTELDQTINDLFEMPTGIGAERETINDKWMPFRLED